MELVYFSMTIGLSEGVQQAKSITLNKILHLMDLPLKTNTLRETVYVKRSHKAM